MQTTAKRVDYIMKPYPVPTSSNGWSGNGVPIEKGHKMGIKKLKKSVKRIERMLDQQSRLIDKALSGGEAPQGDTFVVEPALAENSGGNGFTISEDRQTINYLGENYYSERAWANRGDDSLPDTVMEDEAWARAKLAELDAACLKAKGDLEQAGSAVLLARPLEPSPSVGKLKVSVKDWVRYDQDKSCLWDSCSELHTDQYGCIGVKKFGKRVVLAEINTNWVDRLVNNYLAKKEACDKAAIALNEFSHRNMDKAQSKIKDEPQA